MNTLKKIFPELLPIVGFVLISVIYFLAPIRDGLVLSGQDHSAAIGSNVEMEQYRATHNGERTRWTNTLFCGMPTYQMSPSYPSTDVLSRVQDIYQLGLPQVAAWVFMMLLGFYIMMRCFDFRIWLSALGAIVWAFSSYFFIIIAAGHIWKLLTLSFIPPTIGGMVLCYRRKYLLGTVVTALFTALQILSNHVQMTYYFLFVMGLMSLAFLIWSIKEKEFKTWIRSTACLILGGLLGLSVNLSNLYHTWQYSKESMRGKSELTGQTKDASDQTKGGLERSYITAWSYGIGETWTLLVPNTKGGASMPLVQNETAMKVAKQEYRPVYQAFTQYFGEQPGTSGPVYVGAFVLMLFFLGIFIVKGPLKWSLLVATILSILLSWGHNFMAFTDFFLDYVPLYDKFRTVASILVIAEFTIPLLAMLALKTLIEKPECLDGKIGPMYKFHYLTISFLMTGGVAFLFWLMPDLFFGNYLSTNDTMYMGQFVAQGYVPQQLASDIMSNMAEMRRAMFTADAMRSFIVVAVGTLTIVLFRFGKIGKHAMVACIIVLCLGDMWGVNKRYLNDGMFHQPSTAAESIPATQADELIRQDADPYYRVLNLTTNTFNDNTTSYRHKSIGGYHAAKLRRYQDLIEHYISPQMQQVQKAAIDTRGLLEQCPGDSIFPVLNMLNTKYLIMGVKDGGQVPVMNPWAQGNAWFVRQVRFVGNADEELAALQSTDLRTQAVADKRFQQVLDMGSSFSDSMAQVKLTRYEANELEYEASSSQDGIIVFSDIYYPGWQCQIDGKDVELGRVNYVLRAVKVPAGKHVIKMWFRPTSIRTTESIAYAALIIVGLMSLFLIFRMVKTGGRTTE